MHGCSQILMIRILGDGRSGFGGSGSSGSNRDDIGYRNGAGR